MLKNWFLAIFLFCCLVGIPGVQADPSLPTLGTKTAAEPALDQDLGSMVDLPFEELMHIKVDVASLFNESALDAGSTVNLITRSDWEKMGAQRTFDSMSSVPGTMVYTLWGGTKSLGIRGFSQQNFGVGESLLLDGVPVDDFIWGMGVLTKGNIDLGILDKIEMIRGPNSTIYGTDAFQGVISLKTWNPNVDQLAGEVQGGSFGYNALYAKFSRELAKDLRLSAAVAESGIIDQNQPYTFIDTSGISKTDVQRRMYRSRSLVSKLDYHQFEASFYLNDWHSEGFPGIQVAGVPLVPGGPIVGNVPNGAQSANSSNFWMGKLSHTLNLDSSLSLDSKAFYWSSDQILNLSSNNPPNLSPYSARENVTHRMGATVMLKHLDVDYPLQWLLGYSFDTMGCDLATVYSPTLTKLLSVPSNQPDLFLGAVRTINSGFFQLDSALFSRKFHLLAGTRYDIYSDFGSQISPRVGAIYHSQENSSIKLLYSRGYRAPTKVGTLGYFGAFQGNPSLQAETLDTLELVYMMQEKKWAINTTVFYNKWHNAIKAIPLPILGPSFTQAVSQNFGELQGFGLELEGKLILNPFTFNVSGSWQRSFQLDPLFEFGAFPTALINWGIGYEIKKLNLEFYLNSRYQYHRTAGVASGSMLLPDYFRTDLNSNWSFGSNPGQYQIFLNVQNIFNVDNSIPSISSFQSGIPDVGLNASVGLRVRL